MNANCPSPDRILQALAENGPVLILEHLQSCSDCQQQPELAAALTGWQALDQLTPQLLSDDFEQRVMAQIQASPVPAQNVWAQWFKHLDSFFDVMHVPALAVMMTLYFWLPSAGEAPATQATRWQRPMQTQSLKGHFPFQTEDALKFIIEINRNRS